MQSRSRWTARVSCVWPHSHNISIWQLASAGSNSAKTGVSTMPIGCASRMAAAIRTASSTPEHPLIASGERYTVFDTPWGVKLGILICWDNNLVENARACALLGTEVLLAPHQTGGTNSLSPRGMKPIPVEYWEERHLEPERCKQAFAGPSGRAWLMRWLPSRAHDNGLFIVFSNGVGRDQDEVRTGHAMVLDPYGDIVGESASLDDDMVVAQLDLSLIATSSGRRWMRGRRPELYARLTEWDGTELSPHATRFGGNGRARVSACSSE